MRYSVVVCVCNQEKLIKRCIEALLSQTQKDYEIIIVDDNSKDNTAEILSGISDVKLTVIRNERNQGPSYSRNRGVEQSRGKYILFIDSDCIVDNNWIEKIVQPFDLDPAIAIVSGKTLDPPSKTYWEMLNEGINFIARDGGYVHEAHTCNIAVRGSFIRENHFDESLPYSEDLDLCLSCLKKNLKIYYTAQATLVHFHRSTFRSTIRSFFVWGIYNTLVRLKWKSFPFMDYGTFILLPALVLLLLRFMCAAEILIFIYLVFLFFRGVRSGAKGFKTLVLTSPAGILASLSHSLGNLLGVLFFIRWSCRKKRSE